jgi:hypothetical protein
MRISTRPATTKEGLFDVTDANGDTWLCQLNTLERRDTPMEEGIDLWVMVNTFAEAMGSPLADFWKGDPEQFLNWSDRIEVVTAEDANKLAVVLAKQT